MTSPRYSPIVMDMEPGKYLWCSCANSKKQPFCDGSHGSTGLFPKIVIITEKKNVAWCSCKATSTPPYCDGTHKHFRGE
jgi:CDGSH-type Zn-finger protein